MRPLPREELPPAEELLRELPPEDCDLRPELPDRFAEPEPLRGEPDPVLALDALRDEPELPRDAPDFARDEADFARDEADFARDEPEPLADPLRDELPDLLREELLDLLREAPPDPLRDELEPDRVFPPDEPLRPDPLDPPPAPELCDAWPSCSPLPSSCCCCSWSSSSSPLPSSFLATPTAAGTAIPTAAPATTFFPVDIPPCSLSFSISSLSFSICSLSLSISSLRSSLSWSAPSARLVERVDEARDDPLAEDVRAVVGDVLARGPCSILGGR